MPRYKRKGSDRKQTAAGDKESLSVDILNKGKGVVLVRVSIFHVWAESLEREVKGRDSKTKNGVEKVQACQMLKQKRETRPEGASLGK